MDEAYKARYGIPLSKDALPDLESEDFELVRYQNGKFYVLPTDLYFHYVIRSVQRAVEVKDNLYYAVVHDTEFDEMGYMMVTEENARDFVESPFEEWPENARLFTTTSIQRYMLFKVVNGEVQLYYIGNEPLSLGAIQQYP